VTERNGEEPWQKNSGKMAKGETAQKDNEYSSRKVLLKAEKEELKKRWEEHAPSDTKGTLR